MEKHIQNIIKILHLEDLKYDAELIDRELKKSGLLFEKKIVNTKDDFESALSNFSPDIILSDHAFSNFDSLEAIHILKEKKKHIPFILVTASLTDEIAITHLNAGISDYIIKDRLTRLPSAIINALEKEKLEKEKRAILQLVTKNEMRFRALIEKSTDLKTLTAEDGRFTYGSPSIFKKFGYSPDEFLFKRSVDLIHPNDLQDLIKSRTSLIKRPGESIEFQYRFLHKNGSWIWCEGTLTNLLHEPSVNALVSNFRDITDSKMFEITLIEKNSQLKELSNHLQNIREEERKAVALEIHDELGQQLTALKMDIDWVLHKQTNTDINIINKLKEMLAINDGIINTVRRISSDLRPAILDDLGLLETIEWKCADFKDKTGINCVLINNFKEHTFSKNLSINIYRVLQESFTNIIRHSDATLVNVTINEIDNVLILEISDNGKGIPKDQINNNKTLGLIGMSERAKQLNGEIKITGIENKGTIVTLKLPLKDEYIIS